MSKGLLVKIVIAALVFLTLNVLFLWVLPRIHCIYLTEPVLGLVLGILVWVCCVCIIYGYYIWWGEI